MAPHAVQRFPATAAGVALRMDPDGVSAFVDEYGWRLGRAGGTDYFVRNYIQPTGRDLGASHSSGRLTRKGVAPETPIP